MKGLKRKPIFSDITAQELTFVSVAQGHFSDTSYLT